MNWHLKNCIARPETLGVEQHSAASVARGNGATMTWRDSPGVEQQHHNEGVAHGSGVALVAILGLRGAELVPERPGGDGPDDADQPDDEDHKARVVAAAHPGALRRDELDEVEAEQL